MENSGSLQWEVNSMNSAPRGQRKEEEQEQVLKSEKNSSCQAKPSGKSKYSPIILDSLQDPSIQHQLQKQPAVCRKESLGLKFPTARLQQKEFSPLPKQNINMLQDTVPEDEQFDEEDENPADSSHDNILPLKRNGNPEWLDTPHKKRMMRQNDVITTPSFPDPNNANANPSADDYMFQMHDMSIKMASITATAKEVIRKERAAESKKQASKFEKINAERQKMWQKRLEDQETKYKRQLEAMREKMKEEKEKVRLEQEKFRKEAEKVNQREENFKLEKIEMKAQHNAEIQQKKKENEKLKEKISQKKKDYKQLYEEHRDLCSRVSALNQNISSKAMVTDSSILSEN